MFRKKVIITFTQLSTHCSKTDNTTKLNYLNFAKKETNLIT